MKNILFLLTVFILISGSFASAEPSRDANYGVWESYGASWKHPLIYPDFKVTFKEKKEGPFYPGSTERRMSDVYYFEVTDKDSAKDLKWSAGTGDIGPVKFAANDKTYYFEMLRSALNDESQPDHKILIWTEGEYLKRMELRRQELNLKSSARNGQE